MYLQIRTWIGGAEVQGSANNVDELRTLLGMIDTATAPLLTLREKNYEGQDKIAAATVVEDSGPTFQGTHGSSDELPPADPTVEAAQPKERSRPRRSRAKPAQTTELEAPVAVVELANGSTITLAPSDETLVGSTTPIIVVEEAPAPSAEDATAAMMKYANVKGIAAARSVLAEFNVTRVGEIAADQRAAFIGRTQDTTK